MSKTKSETKSKLPQLRREAVLEIFHKHAGRDATPEPWMIEAIQEAYGLGCYHEASSETFDLATW